MQIPSQEVRGLPFSLCPKQLSGEQGLDAAELLLSPSAVERLSDAMLNNQRKKKDIEKKSKKKHGVET